MTQVSTAPVAATAVPGPTGRLRAMLSMSGNPMDYFTGLRDQYGAVVSVPLGLRNLFLVSDPEAVSEILVNSHRKFTKATMSTGRGKWEAPLSVIFGNSLTTSDGDYHRKQRRLIQPMFHHERIAGYGRAFAEISDGIQSGWKDGQRLDMAAEMTELTLGVVSCTIFDVSLDSDMAHTVRTSIPRDEGPLRWDSLPFARYLAMLPLPGNKRFFAGRDQLDTIVYRLMDERRQSDAKGADLLSLLLEARDADTGKPMEDHQVRDEAVTMLMAGHETTANALTWSYHLLATHPEVRKRLHQEIDEVLGDRLPTVEDLPRLVWTDAVLNEAMRLYPPIMGMARRPLDDFELCGHHIPKDSFVAVVPWVIHRDPQWWPQPERFAPQRWLKDPTPADAADELTGHALRPGRPRLSYIPFGGGPRQCIGNTFAWMEGVMALATVGRDWEFEPVPGHTVETLARITIRPKNGMPLTARRRRPAAARD
ncbi:cytochrome P450 [Streptomyces sp. NBC_01285]|uniref:cytochrome P450 n=1 Tax=Streptomyces sp. NBC_01285 TaxID=2903813 RepID=UPI00225A54B2|nr:cytochrome P450 [Streptomyces sp. NBC_01285]MCX4775233.1 cytochrome P450 [Streptomyces sp. NBC_01285]